MSDPENRSPHPKRKSRWRNPTVGKIVFRVIRPFLYILAFFVVLGRYALNILDSLVWWAVLLCGLGAFYWVRTLETAVAAVALYLALILQGIGVVRENDSKAQELLGRCLRQLRAKWSKTKYAEVSGFWLPGYLRTVLRRTCRIVRRGFFLKFILCFKIKSDLQEYKGLVEWVERRKDPSGTLPSSATVRLRGRVEKDLREGRDTKINLADNVLDVFRIKIKDNFNPPRFPPARTATNAKPGNNTSTASSNSLSGSPGPVSTPSQPQKPFGKLTCLLFYNHLLGETWRDVPMVEDEMAPGPGSIYGRDVSKYVFTTWYPPETTDRFDKRTVPGTWEYAICSLERFTEYSVIAAVRDFEREHDRRLGIRAGKVDVKTLAEDPKREETSLQNTLEFSASSRDEPRPVLGIPIGGSPPRPLPLRVVAGPSSITYPPKSVNGGTPANKPQPSVKTKRGTGANVSLPNGTTSGFARRPGGALRKRSLNNDDAEEWITDKSE